MHWSRGAQDSECSQKIQPSNVDRFSSLWLSTRHCMNSCSALHIEQSQDVNIICTKKCVILSGRKVEDLEEVEKHLTRVDRMERVSAQVEFQSPFGAVVCETSLSQVPVRFSILIQLTCRLSRNNPKKTKNGSPTFGLWIILKKMPQGHNNCEDTAWRTSIRSTQCFGTKTECLREPRG